MCKFVKSQKTDKFMANRDGMDEKQKEEFHLEGCNHSTGCETETKQHCGIVEDVVNNDDSFERNHVKEGNRVNSPLPLPNNPLLLSPSTLCRDSVQFGRTEIGCTPSRKTCSKNCARKCKNTEEKSNDKTAVSDAEGVNKIHTAEDSKLHEKEDSNKNKTTDTGRKETNKISECIEDQRGGISNVECKTIEPDAIDLANFSDACKENKRNAILFYVDSCIDTFTAINEIDSEIIDADETNKSVSNTGNTFICSNNSDRSEGEENLLGNSLDVNFDSGSVNTISDEDEDYLCVQYSESDLLRDTESDLLKDTEAGTKVQTCVQNGCSKSDEESPESINELANINEDTNTVVDNLTNVIALKENQSDVNEVEDFKTEPCSNEIKILKYFQTRSLVKEGTESDISGFESFYSLDNSGTATTIGTPVIRRLKKTLTWTPRILSEERFSSSRSTTLSSDAASFYTAETSGTFYSARSFQLDSCDNFVTCEDFQKFEFNEEPKSKLSKAKDVLVKGRDFVKSKIDCYRKRLPSLAKSNKDIKSRILCNNSCGFSCVQVGKEISLYSIPDTQANSKGGNDIEVKGGNKTGSAIHNESDWQNECDAGMSTDSGSGMIVRKVLEMKKGQDVEEVDSDADFDRENGKVDSWQLERTESMDITGNENERSQSNKQDGQEKMQFLSRETTDENDDELPIGTEATTIYQGKSSKGTRCMKHALSKQNSHVKVYSNKLKTSESDESRSKKRLRWVSAIERTQGTSLTSSLTTNSRTQQKLWECVDQLLYQREMDPELLLNSLGFGGGVQADDTLSRIPDRFLLNQSAAPGVDQYQLVMNHPELHHLLPVMGTSQLMQGSSHIIPDTSHVNTCTDNKQDVVEKVPGNQESKKGQLTSLDNSVEYDVDAEPDNENVITDIPKRFINGNEKKEEVPNSSRILELCGIVPERYLIKSSKSKYVNGKSEVGTVITEEESHEQLEEVERDSNDVTSNKIESMQNHKQTSLNENGSEGKFDRARSGLKEKVSSEKLVVEVEVHDRSAERSALDNVPEENCDVIERVNDNRDMESLPADIETDNKDNDGADEVRDHLKNNAECLKSWSSTSSDSLYDPSADLHLEGIETVV